MNYLIALIMVGVCAGLCWLVLLTVKKLAEKAVGGERVIKQQALEKSYAELKALTQFSDAYASKGQSDNLLKQVQEAQKAVEDQKNTLKQVEESLDKAQKTVEEKEAHQQELKTVKEDDEKKLTELLEQYEQMTNEAMTLEQQLAQSMKDLDQFLSEIELNDSQKEVFNQLSEALVQAGSRLRDLITEYEAAKERLEVLQQQHKDLEEEYTRLVEQQLGI